jgi:hypothetical protein
METSLFWNQIFIYVLPIFTKVNFFKIDQIESDIYLRFAHIYQGVNFFKIDQIELDGVNYTTLRKVIINFP